MSELRTEYLPVLTPDEVRNIESVTVEQDVHEFSDGRVVRTAQARPKEGGHDRVLRFVPGFNNRVDNLTEQNLLRFALGWGGRVETVDLSGVSSGRIGDDYEARPEGVRATREQKRQAFKGNPDPLAADMASAFASMSGGEGAVYWAHSAGANYVPGIADREGAEHAVLLDPVNARRLGWTGLAMLQLRGMPGEDSQVDDIIENNKILAEKYGDESLATLPDDRQSEEAKRIMGKRILTQGSALFLPMAALRKPLLSHYVDSAQCGGLRDVGIDAVRFEGSGVSRPEDLLSFQRDMAPVHSGRVDAYTLARHPEHGKELCGHQTIPVDLFTIQALGKFYRHHQGVN